MLEGGLREEEDYLVVITFYPVRRERHWAYKITYHEDADVLTVILGGKASFPMLKR
jgi:hypothetical protein